MIRIQRNYKGFIKLAKVSSNIASFRKNLIYFKDLINSLDSHTKIGLKLNLYFLKYILQQKCYSTKNYSHQSKLQEIKSKLDILRMSLQKRKTSITLCLIQKESVEPSQEVIVEMEKTVELNRSSIFILPLKNDHLSGYVQRLQNWLLQLSYLDYR